MLRKVSSGADPFGYVDAATRARAKAALDRGDECVLRLQVGVQVDFRLRPLRLPANALGSTWT